MAEQKKVLSFNKRVKMVQNGCLEILGKSDLSKTSNSKSGYYSLKSIFLTLNPLLEKYEINLEILEISQISVHMCWFDDLSDQTRDIILSIEKIKDVPRLASIPNEVQSYGAVLTYVKRYAYTCALRLNSTDVIENNYPRQPQTPPRQPQKPQKPQTPPAPKEPNDKIDNNDIKYFYAVFNKKFEKARLDTEIDDLIKKAFKVESKKDIKKNDLRKMIEYADKATPDQIIKTLNDKIAKNNKK
jgi:hypothetical protein